MDQNSWAQRSHRFNINIATNQFFWNNVPKSPVYIKDEDLERKKAAPESTDKLVPRSKFGSSWFYWFIKFGSNDFIERVVSQLEP